MKDDDLRFGDIGGSSTGNGSVADSLIELFRVLIVVYVLIKVVEILFNIPVPVV